MHNITTAIGAALYSMAPDPLMSETPHLGAQLCDLYAVTPAEVEHLFRSMSRKSSLLNFVPTSLMQACSDMFSPFIARLANLSFQQGIFPTKQGVFPTKFKTAQVTPLVKCHGLDNTDRANIRPISNLNTISENIEGLFLARLTPHIVSSVSYNPLQSAYRHFHSTETALLKVEDDILEARMLGGQPCVALDMLAAFDTNHITFTDRLKHTLYVWTSLMLCSLLSAWAVYIHEVRHRMFNHRQQ